MNTMGISIGIAGLVLAGYFWWRSRKGIDVGAASRVVKQLAEQQRVEIKISSEQMQALRDQWITDPDRPAQLVFVVDGKEVGDFKVATCPYFGDTCCA